MWQPRPVYKWLSPVCREFREGRSRIVASGIVRRSSGSFRQYADGFVTITGVFQRDTIVKLKCLIIWDSPTCRPEGIKYLSSVCRTS